MKIVCEKNQCSGCMACADICPIEAIKIQDDLDTYNAVIDENKCVSCNACRKICQYIRKPVLVKPIEWFQGWAKDEQIRADSSSGGFASAISTSFVKNNGIVYSCVYKKGEFVFSKATSELEVQQFRGSKYVKSNPAGVYKSIRKNLADGMMVLFIGLPCQVSALKNCIGERMGANLYTVDLICHGTPSPQLLDKFLLQYKRPLNSINSISFRVKTKMQIHGDNKGIIRKGVSDKYTIAFVNSLTYTENCYNCSYAGLERVSDITLGDSWGNELTEEEHKKGISLALCQTQKGHDLLNNSEVELRSIDLDNAIAHNAQLDHPSIKPRGRETFFVKIKNGKKFNKLVFKCFTKQCIRQDIKELLIRINIIK